MTVTAEALVFTAARCPKCQSQVMAIPGAVSVTVRVLTTNAQRSGAGRVVSCRHFTCKHLCEVIEERAP